MMIKVKIVFMGTPEFAVATLDKIIEHKFEVVGVVTAPDKPAGRGRRLNQSAVKKYALQKNLTLLQPTNLKDLDFLDQLKKLEANMYIVVAFRMLPKQVWKIPKFGTINLHASLLPDYRGAAPINWAIINGESKTGVTTFFINEKIDTGAIILQKETLINANETAGDLHDKLMQIGSELIIQTILSVASNNVKPIIQKQVIVKVAPKLDKLNCKINWNLPLKEVYNKIRGLSPYPASWSFMLNNNEKSEIKFYTAEMLTEHHQHQPGDIIFNKKEFKVAVVGGFIKILELKMSGKRKMDVKSFLNGYKLYSNAKMC